MLPLGPTGALLHALSLDEHARRTGRAGSNGVDSGGSGGSGGSGSGGGGDGSGSGADGYAAGVLREDNGWCATLLVLLMRRLASEDEAQVILIPLHALYTRVHARGRGPCPIEANKLAENNKIDV